MTSFNPSSLQVEGQLRTPLIGACFPIRYEYVSIAMHSCRASVLPACFVLCISTCFIALALTRSICTGTVYMLLDAVMVMATAFLFPLSEETKNRRPAPFLTCDCCAPMCTCLKRILLRCPPIPVCPPVSRFAPRALSLALPLLSKHKSSTQPTQGHRIQD